MQISITRATPTPKPTAVPSPRTVARVPMTEAIAPRAVRNLPAASSRPNAVRSGAARPKPPEFSHAKPIWDVPVGAQGSAAGNAAGSGNGAGGAGGSDAANGAQPCGYVEFADPNGSQYDPKTGGYSVDVAMTVHFPNRRTESLLLDYPWFYPDAASNPWSKQNFDDPNFPTRFQSPPPEKRASEPQLVQYVIAHSTADGLTLLKSCP